MNEKVVKKMAEVRAFVNLASKILENSKGSLNERFKEIALMLESITRTPDYTIEDEAISAVFEEKRDRTFTKLEKMMELYVGDEWDNPVEVLEWLSFYSGSASAHASFTLGGLDVMESQEANEAISNQLSEDFWQLLIKVKSSLFDAGQTAAKSTN
jgi:hypothetical protein